MVWYSKSGGADTDASWSGNTIHFPRIQGADVCGRIVGVGSAAVQLAKARGAKVVGITSLSKSNKVLSLGAGQVLMRSDNVVQKLGKNSVDVVIDLVAGKKWPDLLDVLKPFGRYAVAGAIGGSQVELDVRTLYLKDLSFFGCTVLEASVFANLIKRIESCEIAPVVARTVPLIQLADAQRFFETKQHVGKLVIDLTDG